MGACCGACTWQADLTLGSAVCAAAVQSGRAHYTWPLTLQSLLLAAGLGRPAIECSAHARLWWAPRLRILQLRHPSLASSRELMHDVQPSCIAILACNLQLH